jgi:membrane protein DedA with SNARE-associated domain
VQQILRDYLEVHGYWVLFLWTFLEGEAGLILAGYLAGEGYLALPGVILTALGGSFCGDQFYYYLGRWQGMRLLGLFPRLAKRFRKGLLLFERYGSLVAFFSRYTYGFRIVLPTILGMTSLPPLRFLCLNLASALTWSVAFSALGFAIARTATMVLEDAEKYEPFIMLAVLAVAVLFWLVHFVHAWVRRRHARTRLKRMRARVKG